MALFDSIRLGASAGGDYEVQRSLRFNNDDSAYLNRTPGSAGNRKTMTLSVWLKGMIGGTYQIFDAHQDDSNRTRVFFNDNGTIQLFSRVSNSDNSITTTAMFRDPAAWYHFVCAIDMTQSTASNRIKFYINGVQQETNSDYPAQNVDLFFNSTNSHKIGVGGDDQGNENYFDGYMAEMHWIDGTALTPASFAETNAVTGQWNPKEYDGSYGTNGFYLNYSDNSGTNATTLGKDSSGNSNNYTPNNFATGDAVKDSPTNNFCTLNPIQGVYSATGTNTYSEGNLKVVTPSNGTGAVAGTMGFTSGKWYAEVYVVANTGLNRPSVGATGRRIDTIRNGGNWGENSGSGDVAYLGQSGYSYVNGSYNSSYGSSYTVGDIVGVALDLDNRTINFYKNNTAQGNISIGSTGDWVIGTSDTSGGAGSTVVMNYGQDSSFAGNKTAQGNADGRGKGDFYYSPPSGFVAMCSANIPDPSIKLPDKHFDILLYTGNAGSQNITGLNFDPDFVWAKNRVDAGYHHDVSDIVRGNNVRHQTSQTNAEGTGYLQFGVTGGFSLTAGGGINNNGSAHVAWCWKGGGSASSNTDGSITSSVSANTSAGFSIVTYTGTGSNATVGHGLGVAPKCFIVKRRDSTGDNAVYHYEMGTHGMMLNSTQAQGNEPWWNGHPTSSVINLKTSATVNGSSATYVAYVFSEVEGYSKFGSYKGNGNADGAFVFTGFRPALVIVKRNDGGTGDWHMADDKRLGYNPDQNDLFANLANDEDTGNYTDILSNGFKFRNSEATHNGDGDSFVYLAFAESPFKYSRAR